MLAGDEAKLVETVLEALPLRLCTPSRRRTCRAVSNPSGSIQWVANDSPSRSPELGEQQVPTGRRHPDNKVSQF
jgi:hypothetical protein